MQITDIKIHQPIGLLRILTDATVEGWCLGLDLQVAQHIQSSCRDALIGQDPMNRGFLIFLLGRVAGLLLPLAFWPVDPSQPARSAASRNRNREV